MDIHFLLIRALLLSFGGVLFTRFFMILDSLHWYFHIWVSGLLIYFAGLLWDSLHQSIQFGFLDVSFGNSFGQVRPGIRVNFGAKHLFELWDWGLVFSWAPVGTFFSHLCEFCPRSTRWGEVGLSVAGAMGRGRGIFWQQDGRGVPTWVPENHQISLVILIFHDNESLIASKARKEMRGGKKEEKGTIIKRVI